MCRHNRRQQERMRCPVDRATSHNLSPAIDTVGRVKYPTCAGRNRVVKVPHSRAVRPQKSVRNLRTTCEFDQPTTAPKRLMALAALSVPPGNVPRSTMLPFLCRRNACVLAGNAAPLLFPTIWPGVLIAEATLSVLLPAKYPNPGLRRWTTELRVYPHRSRPSLLRCWCI